MELTNFSRIGIVGGGPAGALAAYFLLDIASYLDIQINVDIYEPKQFSAAGPKGCNHCGGIVSETLVQMLAMEGINLPPGVVQRGIDAYRLHTEQDSQSIVTPVAEMRIAALFRGGGPLDHDRHAVDVPAEEQVEYLSYDGFLLGLAVKKGANLIPVRVVNIAYEGQLPTITAKGRAPRHYDLVVGAVGVNSGGLKIFESAGLKIRPPKTTKTFITEIYLGRAGIESLGNTMHLFLLNIPRVSFAAIVPKGEYATVIILGHALDQASATAFLGHPRVQAVFPAAAKLSPNACRCLPSINIGMASPLFTDRLVLIGDAGVSRLYKDGLGAAYRTAKACATTALLHGVSRADFHRHYLPACRRMEWDNRIGKLVFLSVELFKWMPSLAAGVLAMVRREQQHTEGVAKAMSMVLWDTFTGSDSYHSILTRSIHPRFLGRLFWESIKAWLRRVTSAP